MLIADRLTAFCTKAGHVSELCVRKKIKVGIDIYCAVFVKFFVTVYDRFALRMVLKEIFRNKWVRLVCASVINTALPRVRSVL